MAIPSKYADKNLHHFTHCRNLSRILDNRAIYSKNLQKHFGIVPENIANKDIQNTRYTMNVTCGPGGMVHDYVPLYFCKRCPMLSHLVYNKIVDEQFIIYFVFSVEILERHKSVFTYSSANTKLNQTFYDDVSKLENLDWNSISKWNWNDDNSKKKKQAEALVYRSLPLVSLKNIVVYDEIMMKWVEKLLTKYKISIPIIVGRDHGYYFKNIKGPNIIHKKCMEAIEYITKNLNNSQFPKFENILNLRNSLCDGLDCLPETLELIGLETENQVHYDDVGKHTHKVVSELIKTSEYKIMDNTDQLLIEIAAYLHDIGKGPKTRWKLNNGVQKIDHNHPINALPMVQRILTEDVGSMTARDAKIICKLVSYHDLIGDIVSKGRKIEELERIVNDEIELNMLIAIAKADMKSIVPSWVMKNESNIENVRKTIMAELS